MAKLEIKMHTNAYPTIQKHDIAFLIIKRRRSRQHAMVPSSSQQELVSVAAPQPSGKHFVTKMTHEQDEQDEPNKMNRTR